MPKSEWAKWKATLTSNYKAIIVSACAAYALVALASSMSRAHTVTSTHRPQIIRDISNRDEIPGDINIIEKATAVSDENGSYKDSRVVESSNDLMPGKGPEAINVEDMKPSTPDVEFNISTTPYNYGIDVLSKKEGEDASSSDSTTDNDFATTAATENEKSFDFKDETKSTATANLEDLERKSEIKTIAAESTNNSESASFSTVFNNDQNGKKSTTENEGSTDGQREYKTAQYEDSATTGGAGVSGITFTSSLAPDGLKSSSKTKFSSIPEAEEEDTTKKEGEDKKTSFIGKAEESNVPTSKASKSTAQPGQYTTTTPAAEASTNLDDTKFSTQTGSTSDKISDATNETSTVQTLESSTTSNAELHAASETKESEETTTTIDQNLEVIVIDDIKKKIEENETPSPTIDNKNTGKLITELGGVNNRPLDKVLKTSGNSENIGIADSVDINATDVNEQKNNDKVNFELQKDEEKQDITAADF